MSRDDLGPGEDLAILPKHVCKLRCYEHAKDTVIDLHVEGTVNLFFSA